jgi:hypothetical protein
LAKYRAGKSQYQALKKELEKLSGRPETLLPQNASVALSALTPSFSDATMLISSLES